MTTYCCFVAGENFPGELAGIAEPVGFFAGVYVDAEDDLVIDIFKEKQRIQKLPVPAKFDELMMLVAPRPMLILSSEWEFYNRRNLLDKCLSVAQVYRDWKDFDGLPSVFEARRKRKSYEKTLSYYKERSDIEPKQMETELRRIGAGDCFGWFSYPGGHSFPPVIRAYTFAWLDRWLDRDDRYYGTYGRP